MLYRGRGDLYTVTQAQTVESHTRLRGSSKAIETAGRAGAAVLKLMPMEEANSAAYNLLCRLLVQLDQRCGNGTMPDWAALALSFRLKLTLTAGFAPELTNCARCGEASPLVGFSPSAGGAVCRLCEGASFAIGVDSLDFMRKTLASPLSSVTPLRSDTAAQVDRAVRETLEHHAHVKLGYAV